MPAEPSRKRPRPGAPDALPGAQAAGPSDSEAGGESEAEEAEEEAELTGAGDPSFAQQHALWREGRFVDVWLQVGEAGAEEGPRVPASRLVLAGVSPYLRKLLLGSDLLAGLAGDTIHVGVPGAAAALAQVVEALYRRRLRLSLRGPRSVFNVLRVAQFLDLALVASAALAFLGRRLTPRNALRLAAAADGAGLKEAQAVAVAFAGAHFGALAGHPGAVAGVDEGTLAHLLASDLLVCASELDVFNVLMAWLDARDAEAEAAGGAPDRTACPAHLFRLLRLQHVPLEDLYGSVAPHPRLHTAPAQALLVHIFAHVLLPTGTVAPSVLPPLPMRRYTQVNGRAVQLQDRLRVRACEAQVRLLCETLPAENPIKFVSKMKVTVGQVGVVTTKSRRGSLKLRFEGLDLPEDKKEYWFPPEALCYMEAEAAAAA